MKVSVALATLSFAGTALGETLFLVNSYLYQNGGTREVSSGVAYYADGNYPPSFRNDYADIRHGSIIHWEGPTYQAHFASGVTVTTNIMGTAENAPDNSYSGTATNGYRTFQCYKTRNPGGSKKLIYTDGDWMVYSDYECSG